MALVYPFPALRFNPARIASLAEVVCPPYDVISPAEQRALYARSPYNLVRLELGLDAPGDDERRNRYTRAAATLEAWRAERVLVQDPCPSLYLHESRFQVRGRAFARRDLLAAVGLEPWERGVVRPHERTMARPKEDRLRLLRAVRVQLSPVWMLYREPSPAVEALWEWARARAAAAEFSTGDGVSHRLWVVDDPRMIEPVGREFASRVLYIADGHHRYETALAYQRERRTGEGNGTVHAYDALLTVLTAADDPGLVVLPIHRLLRGLPAPERAEAALRACLEGVARLEELRLEDDPASAARQVEELAAALAEQHGHHFLALLERGRRLLRIEVLDPGRAWRDLEEPRSAAWRALDVAVLHGLVVDPLLRRFGLHPEDALTFGHDAGEAVAATRGGAADLALLVAPTRVGQVLAVADARDRMPQKSTFFVPKTPTGLALYPLWD